MIRIYLIILLFAADVPTHSFAPQTTSSPSWYSFSTETYYYVIDAHSDILTLNLRHTQKRQHIKKSMPSITIMLL